MFAGFAVVPLFQFYRSNSQGDYLRVRATDDHSRYKSSACTVCVRVGASSDACLQLCSHNAEIVINHIHSVKYAVPFED